MSCGKWSLDREGCRKTRLWGRCSRESISLCRISSTHPGQPSPALGGKPSLPVYLPARLSGGWSPRRRATGEGKPASHGCLSPSLLGLLYFKANSCLFCLNVMLFFFFLKVLAICLTFSHPCWDLRSSPYFTT